MIIDKCYEGIIAELTKQGKIEAISAELLLLKTNYERVLYIYDIIQNLKAFPEFHQVKKSADRSIHYRNIGNKFFEKSDDYKAWQYYNLALLHAVKGDEAYKLALANRSAVFFSIKKYKECLEDLKKVLYLSLPEKLKNKLTKRYNQCVSALTKCDDKEEIIDTDFLTLEGARNSRYVCASSKLNVVYSEEMGRHVVANEDIKVGEVLAQEDPYLVLIVKSHLLYSCNYCLSLKLHLMPCQYCCFALYCSSECESKAWKEYHSVECPLMATLFDMDFTKLELLALRIAIKARTDHSSWRELFKTIADAESNVNSELWGHVKVNGNWVYDSKYYASVHTLASNVDKRSVSDIFQKAVTAAVFLKFLEDQTDFLKVDDDELKQEIRKTVAGTMMLHIMTSPTNMHGLSCNVANGLGQYVNDCPTASAVYSFHSLLNHSCAPNVVRASHLGTGRTTLFALRPIRKGMQLFDNYGSHHALAPKGFRQRSLKFQYKFTCICEACINDWPTYFDLQSTFNYKKAALLGQEEIEELQKADKDTALLLFKPLCELAEELEPDSPCQEVADVQESMKQCLAIFHGVLPSGYSRSVHWDAIVRK